MTLEDARKLLRRSVEDYNTGKTLEAEVRFHVLFVAAVLEPEEIMAAIPEGARYWLVEYAAFPLPKYEDDRWHSWGGMAYREKKRTAEQLKGSKEEDMEHYHGICRLHAFLNERGRISIKATAYFPAHPSYFDNVYSQEEIDKALVECERLLGEIYPDSIADLTRDGNIELVLLREPGKQMGFVFRMSDSVFPAYLAPQEKDEMLRRLKDFHDGCFEMRKRDVVNIMERERGNYFGEIGMTIQGA